MLFIEVRLTGTSLDEEGGDLGILDLPSFTVVKASINSNAFHHEMLSCGVSRL